MIHDVPSRERVKKAGKTLIKADATHEEFVEAMAIMSQWRSLHSYPINTFQAMLRGKVKRLGLKSPIIAQRLKRAAARAGMAQRSPIGTACIEGYPTGDVAQRGERRRGGWYIALAQKLLVVMLQMVRSPAATAYANG